MNAILVCVDYAKLLSVTLPYNRHHFNRVLVVTTPGDGDTQRLCDKYKVEWFATRTFYDDGALFNKFKALEEGLDVLGRTGWLTIMDADVLWPKTASERLHAFIRVGCIYTPLRRMMLDVSKLTSATIPPERHWRRFPLHRQQQEWAGYTQIFNCSDPVLGTPPWHQQDWLHAGGADSFFQAKWSRERKIRPPFEVLHLGASGVNWAGVSTEQRGKLRQMMEVRDKTRNFDHERIRKQR